MAPRRRGSLSFISRKNSDTMNQRTNIQRPSVLISRSSVRLRTLKQETFQRKWILFFFCVSSVAPPVSPFFPNSDFGGWNSKRLQCSVKKLLYIYLFYSWLVFYFSPLYRKTNKLFLKTSRFSLSRSAGTCKKEQKVNEKHLIQAFCIIASTHGRNRSIPNSNIH